ncbi:hypothetical protein [Legionella tunisiensis]|uniref:hypothetical protein n=1 Tax=Legionella tunisiensis TaxID=1034944 RepID=UPI0002E1873A|nr:hypothetical protein [Legionella tunisiensis]
MNQSDSLLDRVMAPLGGSFEKTYSAPLALNLYSVETILIGDKVEQVYPRLKYPPIQIKDEVDKSRRIKQICWKAWLWSISLTLLLWLLMMVGNWLINKRWQFSPKKAGMAALITFFYVLCFYSSVIGCRGNCIYLVPEK